MGSVFPSSGNTLGVEIFGGRDDVNETFFSNLGYSPEALDESVTTGTLCRADLLLDVWLKG